jgi:uncharacterized protein YdaU (DUF1376 family)
MGQAMANEFPYFGLWVKDFLGDNRVDAMTALELGAFVRLLLISWQEEPVASLPDDEGLLARWAKVDTAQWRAARDAVLSCFRKGRDGRLHQLRLRREYERIRDLYAKRSEAGKKGAQKKWSKGKGGDGKAIGKAIILPMANAWHPQSEPESEKKVFETISVSGGGSGGAGRRSNLPCDNVDLAQPARRVVGHYQAVTRTAHPRGRGVENVIGLLASGHAEEALKLAADGYATDCQKQGKSRQHRLAAGTFYAEGGSFEEYLGWRPEKPPTEMTPEELEAYRERKRAERDKAPYNPSG